MGWKEILLWFAIGIIAHNLIVWRADGIADRMALRAQARSLDRQPALVSWINDVRVPTLVSWTAVGDLPPLSFELSDTYYQRVTGFSESCCFISRLVVTGTPFSGSALACVIRLARGRTRRR